MASQATMNVQSLQPEDNRSQAEQELSQETQYPEEAKEFFDYEVAKKGIDALISEWAKEIEYTEARHKFRYFDVDLDAMRKNPDPVKRLAATDLIISIRTADTNIRREHSHFMRYLTQPTRICIFKDSNNPEQKHLQLENNFSSKYRHSGWFMPYFEVIDGSQTHGWDSLEIVPDQSVPLHVTVEHVGHEKLLFPLEDTTNIQECKRLARTYEIKQLLLKEWVSSKNFDAAMVKEILESDSRSGVGSAASERPDKSITLYKVLFKYEGNVWISWYHKDCTNWLKAPEKLTLGKVEQKTIEPMPLSEEELAMGQLPPQPEIESVPMFEVEYPFVLLPYYGTEREKICSLKGRVFLDKFTQLGLSQMYSNFVNGSTRASTVYSSVKNSNGMADGNPKIINELELKPDVVYDREIGFYHPDYPPDSLIRGAQALDVKHSEQSGQISVAANNRVDSRKTAAETNIAKQEQIQVEGVQLLLYSYFLAVVITRHWDVASNRAVAGEVLGLSDKPEELLVQYELTPAGDEEVVKRDQELAQRKEFLPIVAGFPALAQAFLVDTLALVFPSHAEKYAALLAQGDPMQAILPVLETLLQAVASGQPIPPEMLAQAQQLVAQFKQSQEAKATPQA